MLKVSYLWLYQVLLQLNSLLEEKIVLVEVVSTILFSSHFSRFHTVDFIGLFSEMYVLETTAQCVREKMLHLSGILHHC